MEGSVTRLSLMHIDKDWIPAVSAASGAGGAVLAQIVAALFTGRREKRAAKNSRLDRRAELFKPERKELFLRSLKLYDSNIVAHRTYIQKAEAGELGIVTFPTYVFDADTWDEQVSEFNLLAPEICPYLNKTQQLYQQIERHFFTANYTDAKLVLREISKRRTGLINLMAASLGTTLDKETRKRIEKVNKAETEADKKAQKALDKEAKKKK
jgi:hypothetical protein